MAGRTPKSCSACRVGLVGNIFILFCLPLLSAFSALSSHQLFRTPISEIAQLRHYSVSQQYAMQTRSRACTSFLTHGTENRFSVKPQSLSMFISLCSRRTLRSSQQNMNRGAPSPSGATKMVTDGPARAIEDQQRPSPPPRSQTSTSRRATETLARGAASVAELTTDDGIPVSQLTDRTRPDWVSSPPRALRLPKVLFWCGTPLCTLVTRLQCAPLSVRRGTAAIKQQLQSPSDKPRPARRVQLPASPALTPSSPHPPSRPPCEPRPGAALLSLPPRSSRATAWRVDGRAGRRGRCASC